MGFFRVQKGMLKQWGYKCRSTWSQKRASIFKDCEVILPTGSHGTLRHDRAARSGSARSSAPWDECLGILHESMTTKIGCSDLQFQEELSFRAYK